jgi:hypothetical protein
MGGSQTIDGRLAGSEMSTEAGFEIEFLET